MVFDRNSLTFVIEYLYYTIIHAHSKMYRLIMYVCTYAIPILQILLNEYDLVINKTV